MEAKDMLLKLRTEHGLSQDALAEKLFVDAPSRVPLGKGRYPAEHGDTQAALEALRRLD